MLTNPTVVIEVFSGLAKSTYRTQKLEGYLSISKLKECLLVNETEMRIEHYARQTPNSGSIASTTNAMTSSISNLSTANYRSPKFTPR